MKLDTVYTSTNASDIIAINRKSVKARGRIRIIELSTLSDLIPMDIAEEIRRGLLKNRVEVQMFTNQQAFQPWTNVPGFIQTCMSIKHIDPAILPIRTEVLIFNDTVAVYHLEPEVSVTIITQPAFASQQKVLFDSLWEKGAYINANSDGSALQA